MRLLLILIVMCVSIPGPADHHYEDEAIRRAKFEMYKYRMKAKRAYGRQQRAILKSQGYWSRQQLTPLSYSAPHLHPSNYAIRRSLPYYSPIYAVSSCRPRRVISY